MAKQSKAKFGKIPSILAGVTGEYFVAAELSRRGYIASISLRNTRGIDILVTNQTMSKSITIQCKTNQFGNKVWLLDQKSEGSHKPNHFYVFVSLGEPHERSRYHIVPSEVVSNFITNFHKEWMSKSGKNSEIHAESSMRKFLDNEDKYLERWDLLGLES